MTDHHFYSTVIAMNDHATSAVLQHGLIGDARFFSPVRATYFYAWSKKSAVLVNSEKAVDAGTYKFSKLMRLEPKHYVESFADAKRVLLILSSSKTSEQISHRIEPLLNLQNRFGFKLLIKMHPGSLFSLMNCATPFRRVMLNYIRKRKLKQLILISPLLSSLLLR